jgi:hypothetical protein
MVLTNQRLVTDGMGFGWNNTHWVQVIANRWPGKAELDIGRVSGPTTSEANLMNKAGLVKNKKTPGALAGLYSERPLRQQ